MFFKRIGLKKCSIFNFQRVHVNLMTLPGTQRDKTFNLKIPHLLNLKGYHLQPTYVLNQTTQLKIPNGMR